MCTVLITYPTPPPPAEEPRPRPAGGDHAGGRPDRATSVASTTAGIDEAIAATIADELSSVGHQVTCRPCVATPVTGGYDLVVDVERLRVTHRGSPTQRAPRRRRSLLPDRAPSPDRNHSGESTIPMTWSADWRAVDAWARTIGDSLARYLELRNELTRVRTELEHCRELLHAATAPTPPPAVEAPHLTSAEKSHGRHRHRRLSTAGSAREP
jgi:hypothetical protein